MTVEKTMKAAAKEYFENIGFGGFDLQFYYDEMANKTVISLRKEVFALPNSQHAFIEKVLMPMEEDIRKSSICNNMVKEIRSLKDELIKYKSYKNHYELQYQLEHGKKLEL